MEQQIERTLGIRANFAIAGISFADSDLYVKAFRLKHFYRCPGCDQPRLLTWIDGLVQMFRCSNCGAKATSNEALMGDEVILDLVKQMTGQTMTAKTKTEIEELIKLFLADGLPPNITVYTVPVREDWGGNLMIDKEDDVWRPEHPEPTQEEAKAMSLQKEDIEFLEFNIEGHRMLAGFSQLGYSLIVGTLK